MKRNFWLNVKFEQLKNGASYRFQCSRHGKPHYVWEEVGLGHDGDSGGELMNKFCVKKNTASLKCGCCFFVLVRQDLAGQPCRVVNRSLDHTGGCQPGPAQFALAYRRSGKYFNPSDPQPKFNSQHCKHVAVMVQISIH